MFWPTADFQTAVMENVTIPHITHGGETPDSGLLCDGNQMMLFRFVCEVVISLPVAVLGVLGNALAFCVLCWHDQGGATNVLLRCLAVADTFVLLSAIVLRSLRYWHICLGGLLSYLRAYNYIFCWLYPTVYFIRLFDVGITVMLTVERYIAVSHPFRAQQWCTVGRTYKYIAGVCIFSLAFSIPRFFEYQARPYPEEFAYSALLENHYYTIIYRIILFFLVMYLVPMALLIILNSKLWWSLKRAIAYRSSMQSNSVRSVRTNGMRSDRELAPTSPSASITVMVAVVVLVCIVCNVTAMVTHLLWSLYKCFPHLEFLQNYHRPLANVSNVLVNLNSAVNFAIYCLCSRSFRQHLKEMFCRCSCCKRCCCKIGAQRGILLVKSSLCPKGTGTQEPDASENVYGRGAVVCQLARQPTVPTRV